MEQLKEGCVAYAAIGLCMLLLVAGCNGGGGGGGGNSQGTAPSITNLNYSPFSAKLNDGGGSVIITGTIDFTDPDGDVSSLTITTLTPAGQPLSTKTTPVQGASGMASGVIAVSVTVPTTVEASYTFQAFITDATGLTSNRLSGTFSITGVIVTGPSPAHLAILNGALYWSEAGETPIKSISLASGSMVALAPKIGAPASLIIQGQNIFWLDEREGTSPSGCIGSGVIRNLNKTSVNGTTTVLGKGDNCGGATTDILTDGTNVYWVTSTGNTDVILKTPVAGGASTIVTTSSDPIVAMAAGAGNICWMESFFPLTGAIRCISTSGGPTITLVSGLTSRTGSFAINTTSVFYTTANFPSSENLLKVPLTGGTPILLGVLTTTPQKLAADDTNIFWADGTAISSLPVVGGNPAVLASTVRTPLDLVVRSNDVMWSETSGPAHGETGEIKSVPKTGGQVVVLVQGGDAPRRLGWDASWVYWTEGGPIGLLEGFGRIARIPTAGGAVETVVSGVTVDSTPITVSDTHVFIVDRFCIKSVPISGGLVEKVAHGYFFAASLVTDNAYVYWVEEPFAKVRKVPIGGGAIMDLASSGVHAGPAGPIRLQNGTVYWMTSFDSILAVPAAGGAVQVVASGLPFLSDFVVDAANIYFSEHDTGNIKKIPLGGGVATTLANNGLSSGSYIKLAVDNANLFWIDQLQVSKVPTAGGTPSLIMRRLASPFFPASIALDATSIYWTESPLGEIWKVNK